MKKTIPLFLILVGASTAWAEMTLKQAVGAAASGVVNGGFASRVETCEQIASRNKLLRCVIDNTQMSLKYRSVSPNTPISGLITFSYVDGSGDCGMSALVNSSNGVVKISHWSCD